MILSQEKLIERIIRAKVKVETLKKDHTGKCIREIDPDSTAACNCGVDENNSKINSILKDLTIEE